METQLLFGPASSGLAFTEQAHLIDLNEVFSDCFELLASDEDEVDSTRFEPAVQPSTHRGALPSSIGISDISLPVTHEPASIPFRARPRSVPTSKLPSSIGVSLSAGHIPASIPDRAAPAPPSCPPQPARISPSKLPSSIGVSLSAGHKPANIPDRAPPPTARTQIPSEEVSSSLVAAEEFSCQHPPELPESLESWDPSVANSDGLTEQQREERRERNREHAKRSRIRKKFLLESLQDQVSSLQGENSRLRRVVQDKLPAPEAARVLKSCAAEKLPELSLALPDAEESERKLVDSDSCLMQSLLSSQRQFTVSDPSLPDNPIVFASPGFLEMTGYQLSDVLGRNCRFLQGPGTDQRSVNKIREGVSKGEDTSVCLLNYKADGTQFWNHFFVAALRNSEGEIVNYVGVQCEVPDPKQAKRAAKDPNSKRARVGDSGVFST